MLHLLAEPTSHGGRSHKVGSTLSAEDDSFICLGVKCYVEKSKYRKVDSCHFEILTIFYLQAATLCVHLFAQVPFVFICVHLFAQVPFVFICVHLFAQVPFVFICLRKCLLCSFVFICLRKCPLCSFVCAIAFCFHLCSFVCASAFAKTH